MTKSIVHVGSFLPIGREQIGFRNSPRPDLEMMRWVEIRSIWRVGDSITLAKSWNGDGQNRGKHSTLNVENDDWDLKELIDSNVTATSDLRHEKKKFTDHFK
jgi:hypothetical protein